MSMILATFKSVVLENNIISACIILGLIIWSSSIISKFVTKGKIHSSAIAMILGIILAYIGGMLTGGEKGIADIAFFSGIGIIGSPALRDFTIISTAYGLSITEVKGYGIIGFVSLLFGVVSAFAVGAIVAVTFGYRDLVSVTTIGAGAVTFIVGSVTGTALKADSSVIAISIATGVVKSVIVMVVTPFIAKRVGLTTPRASMIYGGLMGTTSGTAAGLAATDPKLVPYGAMIATFYTGLGCLLCPTVLYGLVFLCSKII